MFSSEEIKVFLDELDEKIEILDDGFLTLERDGENPETIQEIFRAAHTIKGSSGVMGFEQMASLTHEMENLFSLLRDGQVKISTEMVDVLFEALDTLKMMRDVLTNEKDQEVNSSAVVQKLRDFQQQDGAASPTVSEAPEEDSAIASGKLSEAEQEVLRTALKQGYNAYSLRVAVEPECEMKSVRGFMVFKELEKTRAQIIQSEPAADKIEEGDSISL